MIDLNGLTCSGSDGPVLEDVTLRLYNGTVYGVTGAGSRELLEILAGVRAFDGGTVNLDGFDLAAEPTRARRGSGYLPSDLGFCAGDTVFEVLTEAAALRGLNEPQRTRAVNAVIEQIGLDGSSGRAVGKLTQAQKGLLGLGLVAVGGTVRWFLSDPMPGLSQSDADEFWETLNALRGNGTVLVATDDETLLARCGSVIRLVDGRIPEPDAEKEQAEETEGPAPDDGAAAQTGPTGEVRLTIKARGERQAVFRALGTVEALVSCRPGVPDENGDLPLALVAEGIDPEALTEAVRAALETAGLTLVSADGEGETV